MANKIHFIVPAVSPTNMEKVMKREHHVSSPMITKFEHRESDCILTF